MSHKTFSVNTDSRCQFINIDSLVEQALKASGVTDGLCCVFCPHTTAAITINENADPDVVHDMTSFTSQLIPAASQFRHREGNSDSHIKSSLFGASETIIIENGRLLLGTWQSVFFCEFDGPRTRKVYVKVTGE